MSGNEQDVDLVREAVRLHQRYQRELVERFSVCPWAKSARGDGCMRTHVLVEPGCDAEALRAQIEAWADDDRVEVAFIIVPRFDAGADAFWKWTAEVGAIAADSFFSAAFHPNAPATAGTVRFLRQTPDPTVQLVRRSRLQQIRSEDPPHYADIFSLDLRDLERAAPARTVAASVLAHNERLIDRRGRAALQAIIDDIQADRARTYGGHAPPPKPT